MDPTSLLILLLMGILAGMINAAVGSGSLLTLPVLLAVGVPPGVAVRTNTIGMFFSTIGSVAGYRREIAAEGRAVLPLVATALVCATAGSLLLLATPGETLAVVVPVLIVVALLLVILQKPMNQALQARRERRVARRETAQAGVGTRADDVAGSYRSPGLIAALGGASFYGGFFTAAQGILYL
ncbi:MAG: sulfite exporter TauE/SafE family protein, partial [Micrococcus sp.]|nr:sulfite exporter TauE/SafE family protein [Micrococcus sp.]